MTAVFADAPCVAALSGWCSQHGRANHGGCRVPLSCGCECHQKVAKQSGIRAETWENEARPQGALTPAASDHRSILETNGGYRHYA